MHRDLCWYQSQDERHRLRMAEGKNDRPIQRIIHEQIVGEGQKIDREKIPFNGTERGEKEKKTAVPTISCEPTGETYPPDIATTFEVHRYRARTFVRMRRDDESGRSGDNVWPCPEHSAISE